MFTVSGKYNTAKVMTNAGIDDATMSQIIEMCNLESLAGENLAIMPDCHAGAGCTIGTTMTISNAVIPNFVGVDIGCGVLAAHLKLDKHPDFSKLDSVIRKRVPSGFDVHSRSSILAIRRDQTELDKLHCKDHVDLDRAALSLGTLGGGNHFIEIDRDVTGEYWLLIHTGSRYLGKQVAEYYQNEAHKQCSKWDEARQKAVDELKRQGRQQEIETYLKAHPVQKLPKQVAHLSGRLMQDYLDDMKICQAYAERNRKRIAFIIADYMGWPDDVYDDIIDTKHNYITRLPDGQHVLRKGAVSALSSERLVIPMNMRDGTLLCAGKGNPYWNYSAPHGAGRIMSRSEAKAKVDMQAFQESMRGIYTTSVCEATKDESPMVYKPMEQIVSAIGDTVSIDRIMQPVYNFKASDA